MTTSKKRPVVAAPMSFAGSSGRVLNGYWHEMPNWYKWAVGWWLVPIIIFMWWTFIVLWYALFGLLLIPYRLVRRGSRKRKIQERQHQEILEALNKNKSD